MNNRILELAKKATVFDCSSLWYVGCEDELEAFYQLAHQDGQKQMRERAEKKCDDAAYSSATEGYVTAYMECARAIRNLEITNE